MSLVAQMLRPFWMPGIHELTGTPGRGFAAWIANEDYQVYSPLTTTAAEITVAVVDPVIEALGSDANRMAAAAFETVQWINPHSRLPKSLGWPIIQSYYAGFYAGHALLRLFGRTCSQLDAGHLAAIHTVADLYGYRAGASLSRGQYAGTVATGSKTIAIEKKTGGDGGSHAAMWTMLLDLLRDLSNAVLTGPGPAAPAQRVAAKLIEVSEGLTDRGGHATGAWLSRMRNRANYQLAFGVWHPYGGRAKYYDHLYGTTLPWLADPMNLSVWPQAGRDLQRFVETSTLIVALCHAMMTDMAERCTSGKSMHRLGALALTAQTRQGRSVA